MFLNIFNDRICLFFKRTVVIGIVFYYVRNGFDPFCKIAVPEIMRLNRIRIVFVICKFKSFNTAGLIKAVVYGIYGRFTVKFLLSEKIAGRYFNGIKG